MPLLGQARTQLGLSGKFGVTSLDRDRGLKTAITSIPEPAPQHGRVAHWSRRNTARASIKVTRF